MTVSVLSSSALVHDGLVELLSAWGYVVGSVGEVCLVYADSVDQLQDLLGGCAGGQIIVVLPQPTQENTIELMLRSGVSAVVNIARPAAELYSALETVICGRQWVSPALQRCMLVATVMEEARRSLATQDGRLTARQQEIVELAAQGLANAMIAERLGISHITVRHHLTKIYSKMDVRDRFEMVVQAYRRGLAPVPQLLRKRERRGRGGAVSVLSSPTLHAAGMVSGY